MISFQYNKTSLQLLEKQLKVRQRTLPIIKNKESALRVEVKKCKGEMVAHDEVCTTYGQLQGVVCLVERL